MADTKSVLLADTKSALSAGKWAPAVPGGVPCGRPTEGASIRAPKDSIRAPKRWLRDGPSPAAPRRGVPALLRGKEAGKKGRHYRLFNDTALVKGAEVTLARVWRGRGSGWGRDSDVGEKSLGQMVRKKTRINDPDRGQEMSAPTHGREEGAMHK